MATDTETQARWRYNIETDHKEKECDSIQLAQDGAQWPSEHNNEPSGLMKDIIC
jgi:hypothetical protein